MKKKLLSFIFAFALIFTGGALLSACGGEKSYSVSLGDVSNGHIVIETETAKKGETVSFEVVVDENTSEYVYSLDKVYYVIEGQTEENVLTGENAYSFVMPAGNVTIYADINQNKIYSDFVFDGNSIVGYIGDSEEIVTPSSYSVYNTKSDVNIVDYKITDIINYGDESSLDYEIWAENISDYNRFLLVGGMYYVSVNGGEKQYVEVGQAEGYFTSIKETYTDQNTIISIEFGDYVLTSESQVEESNFTIIMRPLIEMVAGKLESFTLEYNNNVVNFTKENYLQNMNIFNEIMSAGSITSEIKYDIGNYLLFVEGDDFKVENIKSLSPDQALGGGLFNVPSFTNIVVTENIKTIDDGAFANVTSISNVVIESDEVYNSLVDVQSCGGLIQNATTIKVLKSIVDNLNNQNDFLNNDQNYTKTEEENFYVYSK